MDMCIAQRPSNLFDAFEKELSEIEAGGQFALYENMCLGIYEHCICLDWILICCIGKIGCIFKPGAAIFF